jgi:hypothetical protein
MTLRASVCVGKLLAGAARPSAAPRSKAEQVRLSLAVKCHLLMAGQQIAESEQHDQLIRSESARIKKGGGAA